MQPYMLAVVAAYIAGMMTLSQVYLVPTYMILGLATVFIGLVSGGVVSGEWCNGSPLTTHHSLARFNVRLCVQMAGVSVLFLVVMHVYVRTFIRVSW